MNRYFVALPIPSELRQRLTFMRANLPDARWLEPEDYHITLRFIGECDGPTVSHLIEELAQIESTSFHLETSLLGTFGHDRPRAIYLGIADNPALINLRERVDTAARNVGVQLDGRKFTPHITLARIARGKPAQVARAMEELGTPVVAPFAATTFSLYSSGRSRGGGPYALEESFQLASTDSEVEEASFP